MPYTVDNKEVSHHKLFEFFRNKTNDKSNTTASYYTKAILSIEAFLNTLEDPSDFPSEQILADWFVNMLLRQYSLKTSILLFNSISGLYKLAVKEGLAQRTDAFKNIKAKINKYQADRRCDIIDGTGFDRVISLTRRADVQNSDNAIATDLMLLSLITGCMSLDKIAKLKKDDIGDATTAKGSIIARHVDSRRKYIFDLKQSEYTPRQMARLLNNMMLNLFKLQNLPYTGSISDSIESYWAYAALQCGVFGSVIISVLGKAPKGIPALALCTKQKLSKEKIDSIANLVGETFIINPPHWYAMRLRPRATFDELSERIKSLKNIPQPELFYPMDEIAKRIKRKLIFEKQPVIKNVVFFNSRATDVFPLFCHISDLAWCYTITGKAGSPYAAISEKAFKRFQDAIGHYTTQYRTEQNNNRANPEKGASVKILNGLFQGIEASLNKIENKNGDSIFGLSYESENSFKWNINISSYQAHYANH